MSSTATEAPIAQSVSALTIHGHLFTMKGDGVGYVAHGDVAIKGGRILAAGPTEELTRRYTAEEVIDATDCAVLPGLIDAHMHTPLAIVRGVAQNVAHWMQRALAPYTRHLTDSARLSGCRLNALQALKAGTTTHVDYSLPFPGWMEFYAPLGVQARITPMINARPPGAMAGWKLGDLYPLGDRVGQAWIEEAFEIARHWQGAEGGRVTVMIGPQAPDMFSREQLMQVKRMAQREGLMIHMLVALGCREVDQMLKRFGQRTTAYLRDLGYLDQQLMAAHLTEATDEEATMIARSGSSMCVCSGSIGIISLNLSPVLELPVRNIVPNLVYAAGGSEVRLAIVDGRELVSDGWVLTADEAAIRAEAQIQAKLVANRVAADPVHRDMALLAAMKTGQL